MYETGYRNENLRMHCIVYIRIVLVESQVVPVGKESVVSGVMIPDILQIHRNFTTAVCFSSFCHFQRIADVALVGNTSVFSHFHVVVDEAEMHVVFISVIIRKEITVEQGG